MSRRYCLVSPCRNEAKYIRRTLDSVLGQSELPERWVIVDDGSSDETPQILREYAARNRRLQIVSRRDRGCRAVGSGVIEAFRDGLAEIDLGQCDYVCKLDVDLVLPRNYFATLMDRMESDPRLGTCSGKPYYPGAGNEEASWTGALMSEGVGDDVSVGAAKFYRVACFQAIGGFVPQVMWDGIDCHRCRMLGWSAVSWDDPELRLIHLRAMGSSQRGILTGRARHGFGQYFMGTSPLYMAASLVYRLSHPPRVRGALAMGWGYLTSWLQGQPRYDDLEFRRFLRNYHWLCLTRGKSHAMAQALGGDPRRQELTGGGAPARTSGRGYCTAATANLRK